METPQEYTEQELKELFARVLAKLEKNANVQDPMKSYLVSAHYSDIVEANNADEAAEKMYGMISDGLIKRYEWEFTVEGREGED